MAHNAIASALASTMHIITVANECASIRIESFRLHLNRSWQKSPRASSPHIISQNNQNMGLFFILWLLDSYGTIAYVRQAMVVTYQTAKLGGCNLTKYYELLWQRMDFVTEFHIFRDIFCVLWSNEFNFKYIQWLQTWYYYFLY